MRQLWQRHMRERIEQTWDRPSVTFASLAKEMGNYA
jgi:hypothetical protein